MAIPAWPSQVPYRLRVDGVALSHTYAAPLASETEGGPPILRPRPGPRPTEYPWQSVPLSPAQWQAFELFARDTLRDGTLPFTMPVWRPGDCYVSRTCQLKGGVWQADLSNAPRVRISFNLVVWNL
jgi:hypothetical protein